MTERQPLVSICLPNLNKRPFLEERMRSILAQTLPDWELIVSDNYSDDGAWEVLNAFKNDPRIALFQSPRRGMYANWNVCLERARGRYIHVATSDDTLRPDFLAKTVASLEAHPDAGLAVSQFDFIDEAGRVMEAPRQRLDVFYGEWLRSPHRRPRETEILLHLFVGIPWITASALVFRRALLEKTGLFRTDLGADADRYWSLRASFHSDTLSLPERLATWRQYPAQGSRTGAAHDVLASWRVLGETIDACAAQVPAAWKADPAWRTKLLAGAWSSYLRSFCLDRRALRREPAAFVAGLARALVRQPAYLARRAAGGFAWRASEYVPEPDCVRQLIREWHIRWEPTPL